MAASESSDQVSAAVAAAQEAANASAAAAAAAFQRSTIEIWTLFAVGASVTILRTYARIRAVGIKGLTADDYLVWVGVVFYAAQSALGWSVGNSAHGMANNSMTNAERAALSPDDVEYQARVLGSKIQVAGWTVYSVLIWSLKLSMLAFYTRLTDGLGRSYRIRIHIGFLLVVTTFIAAIMAIFIGCRPFSHYWQINPDPGRSCQAAVSLPIIWVSFAANVSTDIYLIMIPLPMLWQSTLKLPKKIASSIVLGAGVFVLVCATLKSIFVLVDPSKGPQLAGEWGIREAFTAVVVTNLPMIFPLVRSLLRPVCGSVFGSSDKKSYKSPLGFEEGAGGGGRHGSSARSDKYLRKGPPSVNPLTTGGLTLVDNESEERIVETFKMQNYSACESTSPSERRRDQKIVVSNEVDVRSEERQGYVRDVGTETFPRPW